jgi:hypothetical protein
MDVGSVAGHLFLVVRRVGKHLEEAKPLPAPKAAGPRPIAVRVATDNDLDSELHRVVRADGVHVAAWGWEAVAAAYAERLVRVQSLLERGVPEAIAFGGEPMPFGNYLGSRVVEVLVHAEDLALSAGMERPDPPSHAVDVACAFLLREARRAYGDWAVLAAFTRPGRAAPGVPFVY